MIIMALGDHIFVYRFGYSHHGIDGGNDRTFGLTTAGAVYGWGRNNDGVLGDGTTTHRSTPTLVSGVHTWASISASNGYACGVTAGDDAYCWGSNEDGQLGNGTTTRRSVLPVKVGGNW